MASTITLPPPTKLSVADLVLRARKGIPTDGGRVDQVTFREVLSHVAQTKELLRFRSWVFDDVRFETPDGARWVFDQCHWVGPLIVDGQGQAGLSFEHCRFEKDASFYGVESRLPIEFAYCELVGPFEFGPGLSGNPWLFPGLIAKETVFHSQGNLRLENLTTQPKHERVEFDGCELRHEVNISTASRRSAAMHSPASEAEPCMAVGLERSLVEPGGAFHIYDRGGLVREISLVESHIAGEVRYESPEGPELDRLPIRLLNSTIQGRLFCGNRAVRLDLQDANLKAGCLELSIDSVSLDLRREWVLLEPVQELADRLSRPVDRRDLSERHNNAAEQYELLAQSLAASEFDNDRDYHHFLSQRHRLRARILKFDHPGSLAAKSLIVFTILLCVTTAVTWPSTMLGWSGVLESWGTWSISISFPVAVIAGWLGWVYCLVATRSDVFVGAPPLIKNGEVMRKSKRYWRRFQLKFIRFVAMIRRLCVVLWTRLIRIIQTIRRLCVVLLEPLRSVWAFLVLELSFGYGRRLRRFIITNIFIIFLFAGIYWAMSCFNPKMGEVLIETGTNGPQVNYVTGSHPADDTRKAGAPKSSDGDGDISFSLIESVGNSIYFSTMKYFSADTDDMHPHGRLRWVVTIEALIGIFMTAMLVTLLARRYLRLG